MYAQVMRVSRANKNVAAQQIPKMTAVAPCGGVTHLSNASGDEHSAAMCGGRMWSMRNVCVSRHCGMLPEDCRTALINRYFRCAGRCGPDLVLPVCDVAEVVTEIDWRHDAHAKQAAAGFLYFDC